MKLAEVFERIGLVAEGEASRRAQALFAGEESEHQPWYLQAAIGFSMWLAGSLVGVALVEGGLLHSGTFAALVALVLGVIATLAARRRPVTVASTQLVWIAGLAAQVCLIAALEDVSDSQRLPLLVLVQVVIVASVPSRSFRFLSAKNFVFASTFWAIEGTRFNDLEGCALVSVAIAVLVTCFWLSMPESKVPKWRPVGLGLAVGLGYPLFFLSVADKERTELDPSDSLLMMSSWAVLILATAFAELRRHRTMVRPHFVLVAFATVLCVAWPLRAAPAILAGLLLILLGHARGERVLHATGAVFIGGGLWMFYYSMQASLLAKSTSLLVLGAIMLAIFAFIRRYRGERRERVRRSLAAMRGDLGRLSIALGLALAVVTGLVIHKERILAAGQPVFLELRPLDPRSLMQGDYMALDYAIERDVHPSERSGKLVVELDENNVGTLVGEWSGAELGPRQQLIEYRMIKRRLLTDVRIGAETFMFAEGEADRYANARYGELRVSARGEALLVGLADEHLRPL